MKIIEFVSTKPTGTLGFARFLQHATSQRFESSTSFAMADFVVAGSVGQASISASRSASSSIPCGALCVNFLLEYCFSLDSVECRGPSTPISTHFGASLSSKVRFFIGVLLFPTSFLSCTQLQRPSPCLGNRLLPTLNCLLARI